MIFLILLTFSIVSLTIYCKWKYSFWARHNVPGPKPIWFFGNYGPVLALKTNIGALVDKYYHEFSNVPYVGFYRLFTPVVLLREPELIKKVLTTDFNSFASNDIKISKKHDPLICENPFAKTGEDWKESRRTVLPVFSTGKMKSLLGSMENVANQMVDYIKLLGPHEDIEAKNLSQRFTTQNVARAGYSIDGGCFNVNEESEFLQVCKDLFSAEKSVALKLAMLPILPQWLLELLPFPIISGKTTALLERLVKENKESRLSGVKRNDIFQFMIQSRDKNDLTDLFLVAHALSLYIDGTETSAASMSFILYQLAKNQDIQETLYRKIIDRLKTNDGVLTYEILNEFKYLEWVILEGLRINIPFSVIAKICTKEYELPGVSAQPVKIQPGTAVMIPIAEIHMNPTYYPEPEKFDPERFTDDEIAMRPKGTYFTFGDGPRACIGQRFAMLQIEMAIFMLVKNYKIKISPNHKEFNFHSTSIMKTPKDGILLNFEERTP